MSRIDGPSQHSVGGIGPEPEGGPTGNVSKDKLPKAEKNPIMDYFTKLADAELRKNQGNAPLTPQSVMKMADDMNLSDHYKAKFKAAMKDTASDQPLDSKTYKDVTKVLGEASYDRIIIEGLGKDMIISIQNQESQRKAREAERKQIEGQ